MTEGVLEIGKNHSDTSSGAFPWRVGKLKAKVVVASDVTFGMASPMMQDFGCGMVAKSASASIFNSGYEGWQHLPDPYRLKFSFDAFKAMKDDHDFEEITGCACMILLEGGSMLCYEPRFLYPQHLNDKVKKEPIHESLA